MNNWQQIRELFESTVSLAADERERLFARTNAHDAVATVRAMLAADEAPLPQFAATAADLLQRIQRDERPARLCGATLGAYRIDELIGSGGMAHVYRARRSVADTERRVAVKVLRAGLDSDAFLRRFDAERALLAGLEHENIVGLLDAGSLPDGRPFLVMDYVDGQSLTEWATTASLPERWQLFEQILATVQYAHSQLVVHRDLKPSNVLVTRLGAPRLLDFGVATVLSRRPGEAGAPEPLTPVYASPEQLAGDAVTAASDVFALGVVLREISVGSPIGAIESRDLGAIVDKACALAPNQRYASVAELREDVRRLRCGEPVSARRATWGYRARKFVGRHRWPVALAIAVVASLGLGWVGAVLDSRSARRHAVQGWGAHSEAKLAARVFENWILDAAAADPATAARAITGLTEALPRLRHEAGETEVMLRMTLARLCLEHGDRESARRHAERAEDLAAVTRGLSDEERARAKALHARARQHP